MLPKAAKAGTWSVAVTDFFAKKTPPMFTSLKVATLTAYWILSSLSLILASKVLNLQGKCRFLAWQTSRWINRQSKRTDGHKMNRQKDRNTDI